MSLGEAVGAAAALIQFGGSLVVAFAVLRGLALIAAGRGTPAAIRRGRLAVADGVLSALGFETAATLLKTVALQSWTAIGLFAAVLALRTLIKRALLWEEARLRDGPPEAAA